MRQVSNTTNTTADLLISVQHSRGCCLLSDDVCYLLRLLSSAVAAERTLDATLTLPLSSLQAVGIRVPLHDCWLDELTSIGRCAM